jgi:hypothetical protein
MFASQSQASTAIGACIAAAAIVGTPLGGWLLDWEVKKRSVGGKTYFMHVRLPYDSGDVFILCRIRRTHPRFPESPLLPAIPVPPLSTMKRVQQQRCWILSYSSRHDRCVATSFCGRKSLWALLMLTNCFILIRCSVQNFFLTLAGSALMVLGALVSQAGAGAFLSCVAVGLSFLFG